jgi:RHS repeat-associated protein
MIESALTIHPEHLNTPRLVADATGATVWRWDQAEPFGSSPADGDPDANSVAFDLPLRLPGQYFDAETALHYNYARDYDPTIGGFRESDLIGLRGGLNTYAYVDGEPIARDDPLGLQSRASKAIARRRGAKALEELPEELCDYWPAECIKKSLICLEARCTRFDCHGKPYTVTITAWIPSNPTVNNVGKDCICTRWTGDKSQ